ncbi:MAG: hypothetical protein RL885_02080 [Planctomycetota bacterium]
MMRRPVGNAGVTLVELLVAMGLFVALGLMMMQLVRGGLRLWRTGERQREVQERFEVFAETLVRDFRLMASNSDRDPRIRLLADWAPGGEFFRVRWVRQFPEELADRRLRRESEIGAEARVYRLGTPFSEEEGDEGPGYLPTGGLAEVAWVAIPDESPSAFAGDFALYRAVLAPPGTPQGLFGSGALDDVASVRALAREVAKGVLYVDWRFASSGSTSWDDAEPVWDSTREVLSSEVFSEARDVRYGGSDRSLDVFPARVRVTIVLDEGPDRQTRIQRTADRSASEIDVDDGDKLGTLEAGDFVKIGAEWVQVASRNGDRLRVQQRGARDTLSATHTRGTPVRVGRTFIRVIEIPMGREAF